MACGTDRRSSPAGRCPRSWATALAATSSSKAGLARDRNRSPASVRPTLRVVRMKSAAPMRASRARTAWLIAEGVTPSSAAVRRKLRCWATLRNASTPSRAPCRTVKFCFMAYGGDGGTTRGAYQPVLASQTFVCVSARRWCDHFRAMNAHTSSPRVPTIAVIDDDESVRQATGNLLKSLGLCVIVFASAEDFLESPRFDDVSCIISDRKQ